jgi:hypothetical protein
MPSAAVPWGTCVYCGDAYPPGAPKCPTCGHEGAVAAGTAAALPTKTRRHLRFVQGFRLSLIVGAVVLLAYLMVSAAFTPPASVNDPLTTQGYRVVGPGNYTELTGDVTGDDYVVGNYSVSAPVGAAVTFLVLNDTEFGVFTQGGNATPLDRVVGQSAGSIVFSAPYTDTFHFVWENPFPRTSGLVLTIYIATNYESNALVE